MGVEEGAHRQVSVIQMKYTAIIFIGGRNYSATNGVAEEALRELQERYNKEFCPQTIHLCQADGTIYKKEILGSLFSCGVIYRLGYNDTPRRYGFVLEGTYPSGVIYLIGEANDQSCTQSLDCAWVFQGFAANEGEARMVLMGLNNNHWKARDVVIGERFVRERTVKFR